MTNHTDFAVIGGGPAGAMCALLLTQGGAHVTLVDRGKTQSGSTELVSGRAMRLLEEHVGSSLVQAIPGVEVFQTVSLWGTPDPIVQSGMYNPWGIGVAFERASFDNTLQKIANRSGAKVLPHTEVYSIEHSRGIWHLTLCCDGKVIQLYAPVLVIATGHTELRALARVLLYATQQVALMASINTEEASPDHTLYVEATASDWWYALPNPYSGRFVGVCTGRDEIKGRGEPLSTFWNRKLQQTRLFVQLLSGFPVSRSIMGCSAAIRLFDKVSGEGWIAVGDAAFTPDPLSGKGIEFGIESAILAAQVLLAGTEHTNLRDYENWIYTYAQEHKQQRDFYLAS